MNLGIVTVVHSGYGKYLVSWCEHISRLQPQPKVTVVLGDNHQVSPKMLKKYRSILPQLKIIESSGTKLGKLRNVAISKTNTEWIMVLDVDDIILPNAMEELQLASVDGDFILLTWYIYRNGEIAIKTQISPYESATRYYGRIFFHNANPFRRSFWVTNPFGNNDYPGAGFVVGLVEAGARITRVQNPCVVHVRHQDSFSNKTYSNKKKNFVARKLTRIAAKRLVAYYGAIDEHWDSDDSL